MELLNTAKANNQYITDYIKFADTKIAGFIAISSVFNSIVLPILYKWLGSHEINWIFYFFWFFLIAGTVGFVGTLLFSLMALFPRGNKANSLVSFPDIASMSLSDYSDRFLKQTDQDIISEYLKHNKVLSDIALKKFKWLRCATRCCFLWISIFVFLYLIYSATAI
ncbi:MAG: hypothetical protein JNM24_06715 [Bdellovibrionaceae bacterium]|nr:hypothetical protein [Pseudobdellovibrionaceae bacterium]